MVEVEVQQRIRAPREAVWDRYTDHEGWSEWAGLGRVRIARPGQPERDGVGCVRVVGVGLKAHEEVVAFEPPARMQYRVLKGIPIRDHLGEVELTADGEHTLVTWRCRYRTIPGTGAFSRVVVRAVFRRVLKRLATRCFP